MEDGWDDVSIPLSEGFVDVDLCQFDVYVNSDRVISGFRRLVALVVLSLPCKEQYYYFTSQT